MSEREREKQLARREGYKDCWREIACGAGGWGGNARSAQHGLDAVVAQKYPLPKVAQLRVEADSEGDCWRWHDGYIEIQRVGRGDWCIASIHDIRNTSREAIAKVLADPEIMVDDPGPTPTAAAAPPVAHASTCAKMFGLGSHRDLIECTCGAEPQAATRCIP